MLSHGRITGCHHHLSLHIQWSRHHHHVMDSIKKLMISQRCFFLAQIKVGESHFDIQKEAAVLVKHRKVKLGLCFYVASLNVVFFISLFVCGFFFPLFSTMKEGLQCFTVLPAVTPGFAHGQQSMWSVPELKTLQINTIRQADAHWWDYSVVTMVNMALLYVTFSWARTKSFRDFKTMLFATYFFKDVTLF